MEEKKSINFDQRLVPKEELALYTKHILFTTPRNYAGLLGRLLLERGARIVWMPTVEIWPMPDYHELDHTLSNLDEYDWVAFTSENGAEAFCKRFRALGLDTAAIQKTKLAAFKQDSIMLEKFGLKADLVPEEMSPKGMINTLIERNENKGRVLVPCPQVTGVPEPYVVPEFIKSLESIGMIPQRMEVYRTMALQDSGSIERNLLLNGQIDLLIFTSSAEIFSLLEQLGDQREVLKKQTTAYMGSFTAKTGAEMGLNLDIVPEKFTMRGLVEALEQHFAK